MSTLKIIGISIIVFIILFRVNYVGAVGRIERRNQGTGGFQDLGTLSEKEDAAYMDGTHKKLAFRQALIGALIWSTIIFLILYFKVLNVFKKLFF